MLPCLPLLLTLYMLHLGPASAGLPNLAALDLSPVFRFFTSRLGSKTGRLAVATSQRCSTLMKEGPTSDQYLQCKKELEYLVIDLFALEELKLEKCVISKVQENTAECPVRIWLRPRMISVTHPLLVSEIKSQFAPKSKDREYSSTALVNGVRKKVKIIVHGHQESSEDVSVTTGKGKKKSN